MGGCARGSRCASEVGVPFRRTTTLRAAYARKDLEVTCFVAEPAESGPLMDGHELVVRTP